MQTANTEFIRQLRKQIAKSKNSLLPRYKQLYEAIRQQILEGLLMPNIRLPSSRIIAKHLKLSRNTVLAAIEQLCVEGYTKPRNKSGIYVLATAPIKWDNSPAMCTPFKPNLSRRGKKLIEQSQICMIRGAFALGIPDLKAFPYELWQRYVARHMRNPKLDWLINPQQGGDSELRQALAEYLRIARGIQCEASQILITHGTQHSLQLIANLLADPDEHVWMEDPGYPGARAAFTAANLNIFYQPVDKEGISPPKKAWQHSPRFIYTTPSHQFPTGVIMSAARRRSLLDLAAQHQTWIIEDDYDSEFRYAGAPLAAMQALAPNQVLYLGTYSKIFFPAIRMGYIVLPKALVDPFRITQVRHLREPSYIIQKALADFIRDGHASTYIRKMRREYQLRHDTLKELLNSELGDAFSLEGLNTGLHLPSSIQDHIIADQAYKKGIALRALNRYYANPTTAKRSALLLGFGDADTKSIKRAGKILCEIIHNYS